MLFHKNKWDNNNLGHWTTYLVDADEVWGICPLAPFPESVTCRKYATKSSYCALI